MNFLSQSILENTVIDLLWFTGICVFGVLIKRYFSIVLSKVLYRVLRHDKVPIYTCIELLRKPLEVFVILTAIWLASYHIKVPKAWHLTPVEHFGILMVIWKTFQIMLIMSFSWILIRITKFLAIVFQEKAALTESKLDDQFVPFTKDLVIVALVLMTFFSMLGIVFKIDVIALITGLGIGGLAIALAARETLENLFASFTIFLDLPFLVGDTILLDKVTGDVEKIGFRSTRIRTGDGSLVTVPNRLITAQALENLSQRNYRRARYALRLRLDTPTEAVKAIVNDIQTLVESHDKIYHSDPGKTRFDAIGDNSLDILVSYHVATNSIVVLNEVKEEINYQILSIVQKHQAQLAYPTFRIIN
ncbi:mechanosensitive ion channel family protein [Flectobacillus roseus]|uniref:mechanosensitive ion channel family protein n=1 Tax=Flectobacillus roseus TaxID=502259 RepID=UPI0024B7F71F|nr:mechanosensitive ion channel domain-containing protein [Flectobacillus roseus]MDI9870427.1 mechanosensitive ion channel [Flectobacillus roseus]